MDQACYRDQHEGDHRGEGGRVADALPPVHLAVDNPLVLGGSQEEDYVEDHVRDREQEGGKHLLPLELRRHQELVDRLSISIGEQQQTARMHAVRRRKVVIDFVR